MKTKIKNPSDIGNAPLIVVWAVAIIVIAMLLISSPGCQSAAVKAAHAATEEKEAQIQDEADVDVATVQGDAKVADAKAAASPTAHPITTINATVTFVRKPLLDIAVISFILFAVSIGLAFTALSMISKIAVPICGTVCILSFAGVIALPFLPWVFLVAIVAAVGLIIYEIHHYKSVKAALQAIESDLGISSATETTIETKVTTATAAIATTVEKAGTAAAPIVLPKIPI